MLNGVCAKKRALIMAHAILSRGKKSRPERRALLVLRRMFGVERWCPHRLPSRSFASFASFARTTRPSLPPRLRGGSVGLGTKTAPVPGGCGSRALKTLFSPIWTGLSHGSQRRFPTVPDGSRRFPTVPERDLCGLRFGDPQPSTLNPQPT